MAGSRPEFPQASAHFSGSDNPDLHTISFPIVLLKVLCRRRLPGGRYGKIDVGLFVAGSQYFLRSVTVAFAYGVESGSASGT
jgi:hypothetical protein